VKGGNVLWKIQTPSSKQTKVFFKLSQTKNAAKIRTSQLLASKEVLL